MLVECASQECFIVLRYVIPSLGSVTSALVYLAAMPVVVQMIRYLLAYRNTAGRMLVRPKMINPLPYSLQLGNGLGITFYSVEKQDLFLSWVGFMGICTGIFYVIGLVAYGFFIYNDDLSDGVAPQDEDIPLQATNGLDASDDQNADADEQRQYRSLSSQNQIKTAAEPRYDPQLMMKQLKAAVALAVFGPAIALVAQLVALNAFRDPKYDQGRATFMGSISVSFYTIMLASPLTVIRRVIKNPEQTSKLIYGPLAFTYFINGSFWAIYGLVIADYFILLPNLFSALNGLVQLALLYLNRNKVVPVSDEQENV
ncbi:hypothetical protein MIR68_003489 [Amoeboaphelidium protococcarum]|nr:hypothetical protein MIR68_003489 [Amoeboaphelidium protococcarum]